MEATKWQGFNLENYMRLDIHLLDTITYSIFGFAGFVAISQFFITSGASYGRYVRAGYGCYIDSRLAWFVWELPSIVIPIVLLVFTSSPRIVQTPNRILFGCFVLHYIHRSLIYPLLIRGGKPASLVTFVFAVLFCVFNGYLQAAYFLHHADFGEDWNRNPLFYFGLCMFFLGLFINVESDHILRTLRKPGETGYNIPRGGLFTYVSGANFFGEILEWFGFAVANGTLPTLAFFLSTTASIAPRAFSHHRWYKEKFDDYPTERKALIPLVI
ncbi:3-oxo-5-alpha-steroid 4-dehydrogenase 1-like isoform X1 [Mizuhopecten yessoensis]|uniref:3-oxo-5alpha-steroid 4-dehydrogenase (NADP(+)) n=1 Tax=Mizuhopecten yessoensis TaxID=6573 RepID=A0A210QAY7_MIZYE|nr:3-oxo-5-alpha-steroid 4-dehydrogenase 1-like isoform X1 [Mizuhopecten yessoensis]OWF45875.1 3-oxo-5-alpha-steroid 4-dehydrogenase 1 [Mizuhopecten yessoensis]